MTMTTIKTFILAACAAAVLAGPAAANPYQHRHLVQGVVDGRIAEVFNHDDREARRIRAAYLAGFSLWYDSRCDFLPMPTFEAIKAMAEEARRNPQSPTAEAANIGEQDAKAFLGEEGCATRTAQAARGSLERFWEDAVQRMSGQQRQVPPAAQQPGPGAGPAPGTGNRIRL
jgi:hypothetical protein